MEIGLLEFGGAQGMPIGLLELVGASVWWASVVACGWLGTESGSFFNGGVTDREVSRGERGDVGEGGETESILETAGMG